MSQLDKVFDMTTPIMGRTDILETALKQRMGREREFIQVGARSTCSTPGGGTHGIASGSACNPAACESIAVYTVLQTCA
jgi:hypothetical protein